MQPTTGTLALEDHGFAAVPYEFFEAARSVKGKGIGLMLEALVNEADHRNQHHRRQH